MGCGSSKNLSMVDTTSTMIYKNKENKEKKENKEQESKYINDLPTHRNNKSTTYLAYLSHSPNSSKRIRSPLSK